MFEARDTNFETIFYGPSLLFILLLADSHACLQQQSRRLEAVYSRLGSCYGFHKGSKALNLSVKTTTTTSFYGPPFFRPQILANLLSPLGYLKLSTWQMHKLLCNSGHISVQHVTKPFS